MSHLGLKARKSSLILLLLLFSIIAKSNSVYTSCQGKWDDPNSWRGGTLPVDGDSIFINHSLHLTNSIQLSNPYVHVSEFGALSGEVEITTDITTTFITYGYIDLNWFYSGGIGEFYGSNYTGKTFSGTGGRSGGGGLDVPQYESIPYYPQLFVCGDGFYLSPSGKRTYTKSGTYLDTIAGSGVCDSIISVELTLKDTTTKVQATACYRYESPSGNYTWTESGVYNDVLISSNDCDSVVEIDLTIKDCSCEVFVPNAFAPYGLGLNEVFYAVGGCNYANFELIVYTREGIRIFLSNDINLVWNGSYMGQMVQSGTYIYSLKYENEVTGHISKYGIVTLFK